MIGKHFLFIPAALLILTLTAPGPVVAQSDEAKGNPAPRKENFSKWPDFGAGEDWLYLIVDGNGGSISVNGALPFDNSTAEITDEKELHFIQTYDTDFDDEFPWQYNNIFMVGFQGYIANAQRDIVWNFDMKIEPGTYGTTGLVIEPKDTFAPDGNVAIPFNMFGVVYAGEENYNAGLSCSNMVDFMLVSQDLIAGVDPFQWNSYEIRFHFVDDETVLATISVNDTQVCQSSRVNYGETEIQIWLDNYKVTFDPSNPQGYSIGYNNKETAQGVLFDNIQAKAKPAK